MGLEYLKNTLAEMLRAEAYAKPIRMVCARIRIVPTAVVEVACDAGADADEGRWITTEEGHHVHLDENGTPDKGNPHVIAEMNGGGAERGKIGSESTGTHGNGNPLVTPEEDAAYMDAVKHGDAGACEKMVRDLANKAMPLAVQDSDGKPKVLYHGTDWDPYCGNEGPAVFEPSNGVAGYGVYLIDNEESAKSFGNNVIRVFARAERFASDDEDEEESREWYKEEDGDYYIAYVTDSGIEIKSADPVTYDDSGNPIPLSQRFDFTKDDIRY